jgi:hypothetical protein
MPSRWVLVYAGGPSKQYLPYTIDRLVDLIATIDTNGRPTGWLTTGAILLQLWAVSGHVFSTNWSQTTPRADGDDWATYLDSLFLPGGVLDRTDSAVLRVERVVGWRNTPYRVALMIPYPSLGTDSVRFKGATFDRSTVDGRTALAAAYVTEATARFASAHYHDLMLDGFYWLREDAEPYDTAVIRGTSVAVHGQHLRFLWIPGFRATSADRWRVLGFDEAWHQPNYFFTPTILPGRIDSAYTLARSWGMGIEIEFNRRMFAEPEFSDRLDPYLQALEKAPDIRRGSIAVYEGAGALIQLAQSRAGPMRERYRFLVRVLGP